MSLTFNQMLAMCDESTQNKLSVIKNDMSDFLNKTQELTGSALSTESVKSEKNNFTEDVSVTNFKQEVAKRNESNVQHEISQSYSNSVATRNAFPVRTYNSVEVNGTIYAIDDELPEQEIEQVEPTPQSVEDMIKNILKPEPAYCGKKENARPASDEQIQELQNTIDFLTKQLDDERQLSAFRKKLGNVDLSQFTKKEEQVSKVAYKRDSCIINGKEINFKRVKMEPDWNYILSKSVGVNKSKNLSNIKSLITMDLKNQLGGWNRVKTIYVYDSQLIINGICFMPVVKGVDISSFPLDTADYIKNGAIAPFLDWKYLTRMNNLVELGFDDATFMITNVADDLGLGRRMGVTSLFKICDNLMVLNYGDTQVTRDDLKSPEKSKKAVEKLAVSRRKIDLLDGFHLNVYKGTDGFQDFTFNCLKNYATNRGNRGWLRFAGGTAFRAVGAAFGLALNLGVHLIGGVKNLLSDATKPITDEDLGGI